MKAKSLILAGAVAIASTLSASAQTVFSVNAVGFVNQTFNPGFSLVSNPLVATDNSVESLFASVPNGTQIYKFDAATAQFTPASKGLLGWINGTLTVVPGEAIFVFNPDASPFTITFVGNVNQGSLTNSLVAGFNMVSSQVPQAGLIETDLGAPIANGETIYKWNGTTYDPSSFGLLGWLPSEPTINVGEGFWINKVAAADWTRNFDVNNP